MRTGGQLDMAVGREKLGGKLLGHAPLLQGLPDGSNHAEQALLFGGRRGLRCVRAWGNGCRRVLVRGARAWRMCVKRGVAVVGKDVLSLAMCVLEKLAYKQPKPAGKRLQAQGRLHKLGSSETFLCWQTGWTMYARWLSCHTLILTFVHTM